MKLKTACLLGLITVILLVVSGCGGTKKETDYLMYSQGTINSTDSFINKYKNWTTRLEALADQTKGSYKDWENQKINTEKFIMKSMEIYQAMKKLNDETDLLVDYKLSDSDKQRVKFEEVISAYSKASKDLNDYLYQLPRVPDDQIKAKHKEVMEKYDSDVGKLKGLLGM